jgi:hypothetical protein
MDAIKLADVPKYSVAKLDYGVVARINLPDLYPCEEQIIAHSRPFMLIIKLVLHGTVVPNKFSLKRQIICMLHDGPKAMAELYAKKKFPRENEDVLRNIQIFLGCSKKMFNRLRKGPILRELVTIRPEAVFIVLRALKALCSYYADIEIDESPERVAQFEQLQEMLLNSIRNINNPTLLAADEV